MHILETHLHSDHITGAVRLRASTGALIAVSGASGIGVLDVLPGGPSTTSFGEHQLAALATPGHTDACMSYYIDGMVFTGDCLLISGTGRTDLPGGSAESSMTALRESSGPCLQRPGCSQRTTIADIAAPRSVLKSGSILELAEIEASSSSFD